MKKNLKVEAAVLDLCGLTEETLAGYEKIEMEAAQVLVAPETEKLIAQYGVKLDAANIQCCPEGSRVSTVNGKATISAATKPEKMTFLTINGRVTVMPDAAQALDGYYKIVVNGKILCPESLAARLTAKSVINGVMSVYPDEAVVLNGNVRLDKSFVLRAADRLYWTDRSIIAMDLGLDAAALAAKGARFDADRAIIAESLAEKLVPLFTEQTELILLPDGTAVVEDDLELTAAKLRRYGSRMYVLGDVSVEETAADALEKVEYLHVRGDVLLPEELEDAFYAIPDADYDQVRTMKGHLVRERGAASVTPELLALYPKGISFCECGVVTLDPSLAPETILKMLQFESCGSVQCTKAQQTAVMEVGSGVAHISLTDAQPEAEETQDDDTVVYSGAVLKL